MKENVSGCFFLNTVYNTHPHISTQQVSISAKNGDERTWS